MSGEPLCAIEPPAPVRGLDEWPGPPIGGGNSMLSMRQAAPRRTASDAQRAREGAALARIAPACFRLGGRIIALRSDSAHLQRIARYCLTPSPGPGDLALDAVAGTPPLRLHSPSGATLRGTRLARDFLAALAELDPSGGIVREIECLDTADLARRPLDLPRWLEGVFECVGDAGARTIAARRPAIDAVLSALTGSRDPGIREWLLGFETSEIEDLVARLLASRDGRVVVRREP